MTGQVELQLGDDRGSIRGFCDDRFAPVLDAFRHNFESGEEVGAAVCFSVDGETVVDLWGGRLHPKQEAEWQADTVCVVHSVTKAAVSLCAHILLAEGRLELHAPVADYWPEFAAAGKQDITVEMMLNHTAGLAAVTAPVKEGGFLDWEYMTGLIAAP